MTQTHSHAASRRQQIEIFAFTQRENVLERAKKGKELFCCMG
jgi:hypothetical protein